MRPLALLALFAAAALLAGCNNKRDPIPVINITVLSEPGTYLLDGERLYLTELRTELQHLADKYRRATTPSARAQVVVSHSAKIPYHRVEEVLGMCGAAGLDKVSTQVRDESVPLNKP